MESTSNKIFYISILIVIIGGIYLNMLARKNHTLNEHINFLENYSEKQEKYIITLEECLWDSRKYASLENSFFRIYSFTEKEKYPSSKLPPYKLIVNCGKSNNDTILDKKITEVLQICNYKNDLQIICPEKKVNTINNILLNSYDYQIWIPEEESEWLKNPSVFVLDNQKNIYHYLPIHDNTLTLFIKYIRFIENNNKRNKLFTNQ